MKNIIIALLVIAIALLLIFKPEKEVVRETPNENATSTPENRAMSIEDYVRLNISDLSQRADAEEVLGGKFYVTSIEADNGVGVVSYEDGHVAYTADFTYSIGENGFITITSFKVRE